MTIEVRHVNEIRTDCFNFIQSATEKEVKFTHCVKHSLSAMDEEIEGFRVVAQALSKLGVKYMFGVVGIPVIEVNPM